MTPARDKLPAVTMPLAIRHQQTTFDGEPVENRFFDVAPCQCCGKLHLFAVDPSGAIAAVDISALSAALDTELDGRLAARKERS